MIYMNGTGRYAREEGVLPQLDNLAQEADLFGTGDVLRLRLRASAQLLTVLAEQTEAVEQGDTERAEQLDGRRRQLERELVHAYVRPVAGEPRSDVAFQLGRILDQAMALLEDRSEEEQRLRDWMDVLQDASLGWLRAAPKRERTDACRESM
jgi:hypothetical protein